MNTKQLETIDHSQLDENDPNYMSQSYKELTQKVSDLGTDWREGLPEDFKQQLRALEGESDQEEDKSEQTPQLQQQQASESQDDQANADEKMVPLKALQAVRSEKNVIKTDLQLLQEQNAQLLAEMASIREQLNGNQNEQQQPSNQDMYAPARAEASQKLQELNQVYSGLKQDYDTKKKEIQDKMIALEEAARSGSIDTMEFLLDTKKLERDNTALDAEWNKKSGDLYIAAKHFESIVHAPKLDDLQNDPNVTAASQKLYDENKWIDNLNDHQFGLLTAEAQRIYDQEGHIPSPQAMIRYKQLVYAVGKSWKWDVLVGGQNTKPPVTPPTASPQPQQQPPSKASLFPPNMSMAGHAADPTTESIATLDKVKATGSFDTKDMDSLIQQVGGDVERLHQLLEQQQRT